MLKLLTALSSPRQDSRTPPESTSAMVTKAPTPTEGSASRKHLLAVVLKETLLRNRLPAAAIGLEFFRTLDRSGARTDGIHVRLMVRDAQASAPACMMTLERDFRRRLTLIDYRATEWLQGVSWQFDLGEAAPAARPAAARPALQDSDALADYVQGRTFASTEPAPL